jgi:restriction system protein
MAKKSFLDTLYGIARSLPWWLAIPTGAGIGWWLYHFNDMSLYAPIFRVMGISIAVVFAVAAAASLRDRLRERRLYNQQQSTQTIRALSWQDFERLIAEVFRRQGYTVTLTKAGPDGGIDVDLSKGGKRYLVQCKQYRASKVGVPKVRELAGVVATEKAAGGIFVSSGRYTKEARRFAAKSRIQLIDGRALAKLMDLESGGLKGKGEVNNETKAGPCPRCGKTLVLRTARRGKNAGQQFYGCSGFPDCRYARSAKGTR